MEPDNSPAPEPLSPPQESVLSDLTQAQAHFQAVLDNQRQQEMALDAARAQVAHLQTQLRGAQEVNARLAVSLQRAQDEAARERTAANALQTTASVQQGRAQQLEAILQGIHKSFASGNVYALLLKACLSITGASRGVYVTMRGTEGPLQIRAAVDVDDYPDAPPSEFMKALCARVLDCSETFIAHNPQEYAALPPPKAETERFRNVIAAPVALLKNMNGIVVCADKDGDFSDDDVQSVIAVGNQAVIAAENTHLRRQIQQAYLSTVSILADAMEAKDSYTQGHCEAVSRYATRIGRHLNLSDYERSVVSYAALLHDIGKIGVSDGLLNKPGPLHPEERELVRAHVRLGHDLIQHVPALRPVAQAVLHHHECFDGSGYPAGLAGDAIPIAARIVCVVDAFSAMTTRRSYKEASTEDWAREELRRCAGTQFDPRVVDAFLYVLDLPNLDNLEDEDAEMEWLPGFTLAEVAEPDAPQTQKAPAREGEG